MDHTYYWNKEELDFLIERANHPDCVSMGIIQKELEAYGGKKRSVRSLCSKMRRLGLNKRKVLVRRNNWTVELVKALHEAAAQGLNSRKIQSDFIVRFGQHFSIEQIRRKAKFHGLKIVPILANIRAVVVWTPDRVEYLKRRWSENATATEIMKEFSADEISLTRNAIIGKLHRLGIVREITRVARRSRSEYKPKLNRVWKPRPKQPTPAKRIEAIFKPDHTRKGIPLLDAKKWHCHYPLDRTDEDNNGLCCGDTVTRGTCCAAHAEIMYAKPSTTKPTFSAKGSRFDNFRVMT